MDFRQLKTFITITALGSFKRAAETLYYAQSTVSDQIKNLEQDLDVKLFHRHGNKIQLTSAGKTFNKYCQKLLNIEDEIRTEVKEQEETRGSLTIRVPETFALYYLPEILIKFCKQYPAVNLNLTSCTRISLKQELISNITDIGFLILDKYDEKGIRTYQLKDIPLSLIGKRRNNLYEIPFNNVQWSDESVLFPNYDCSYHVFLERLFEEKGIKPKKTIHFNSIYSLKIALLYGLGIAHLPTMFVEKEIEKEHKTEIVWPENRLDSHLFMMIKEEKWLSPLINDFIQITKDYCK